jgi:hypothetical protein
MVITKTYLKDLSERVVATFFEGFIATFVITQVTDQHMWLAAIGGGVASVLSLFKGLAARAVGDPNSASMNKAGG